MNREDFEAPTELSDVSAKAVNAMQIYMGCFALF
jgi:hypothetical protein